MSDDKTPPNGLDTRGKLRLAIDKATIPDDTPTGETCPGCATFENGAAYPGDGTIRYEDKGGKYHTIRCDTCDGEGWCSADTASRWRIRYLATGKR